jgi:hypothetical protein
MPLSPDQILDKYEEDRLAMQLAQDAGHTAAVRQVELDTISEQNLARGDVPELTALKRLGYRFIPYGHFALIGDLAIQPKS